MPGGLLGIVAPKWWPQYLQNWFNNAINEGFTGVAATVELAAPASSIELNTLNLLFETGTALSLPVKIKLDNALLGSNCYVGSNSNPIVIDFTSGETSPPEPNEPIHGSAGTAEANEAGTLLTLSGGALVNNSFAAPEADGCGGFFSFFIDPLVNSILGLPAAGRHQHGSPGRQNPERDRRSGCGKRRIVSDQSISSVVRAGVAGPHCA